jgi:Enoyl-(Acyl carrier protein) reductase
MKDRPGAAVINVASISGWSPQLAMSGQYGAAKAALIFDTERWALEFVPHGIRVNTVSPGSILVEGNGWDRYRLANPAYFDDYVRHGFPMDRLGTAEEVADVVVFIAARLLDQWPQYSGGRSGAAARAARSPAILGLSHVWGSELSQEMTMPGDLLSGSLIEIACDLHEKRVTARELIEAVIVRHDRFGECLNALFAMGAGAGPAPSLRLPMLPFSAGVLELP